MKTIFVNGRVFTGTLPLQEAFSVRDGRFVQVDSNEVLRETLLPGDRFVDLEGRFVCPGFNDSHMHLLNFGYSLECCDLSRHTDSLLSLQDALRDYIRTQDIAPGEWVRGRGWNQDYFSPDTGIPTRRAMDSVSDRHPICITRCCGHCLAVNTRALEMLGLMDCGGWQAEGGRVDVDEDGVPTGVFRDEAMSLVLSRMPTPGREEIRRMLRNAARAMSACGVTSVQTDDFCAFDGLNYEEVIAAYRSLIESGELPVRVCEQSQFTTTEALSAFLNKGYNTGWGDDRFRIGPLKLLGDGSLGARTAFLSRDYADAPGERGLAIFTQEALDGLIGLAHSRGMQVAVHVIGDGILDRVLLAYERAFAACPCADHRSGLVHVQITRPDQLRRIQSLKLHAYVQSVFLNYDTHIVKERVGEALAAGSYAFHTLHEMGLHVSNGTDCPVEYPDPMRGIQCAVTRRPLDGSLPAYRPEEAMSLSEALLSYTREGAYASFEERDKGLIAPGMLADFTVLSDNPFEVPAESLHRIHAVETWLGGKRVYEAHC